MPVMDDELVVGRATELDRLTRFVRRPGLAVVFLHGVAGVGKSTILRCLVTTLADCATVSVLDCREIEPTPAGFLAAVEARGVALGVGDRAERGPRAAVPVVVCLDQYESFRLLDSWLRRDLVPHLPADVTVLVAGRERPHPEWQRLPAGRFATLQLGPLARADAERLVRGLVTDEARIPDIVRLAGGHPLTLVLAGLAANSGDAIDWSAQTMDRLLDQFTAAYFDELVPDEVELLEAASVVRRVTRPLLAALAPTLDPVRAYAVLRSMPFVDRSVDGLVMHESVQWTVRSHLRAADPEKLRTLRGRAWNRLRSELAELPRNRMWHHTADMIYLIEQAEVREAHFPTGAHSFAVENARAGDRQPIEEIIRRHEPTDAAKVMLAWLTRHPDAFRVARDVEGAVAGFSIVLSSPARELGRYAWDPAVRLWTQHMAQHPIPANQVVNLIRRWLTWGHGDLPCEAQASLWLDLKRSYMELRPRLRRNYGVTDHPEVFGPVMEGLHGGRIDGEGVCIGGRQYHGLFLEFGPASVDGWLSLLAAEEVGVTRHELLDVARRQLVIDDERLDLTPKEFDVMQYLCERAGDAVPRYQLLADVWGYEADIASNVVDAVVCGLRKKLASRSPSLETVRGVGYRLLP